MSVGAADVLEAALELLLDALDDEDAVPDEDDEDDEDDAAPDVDEPPPAFGCPAEPAATPGVGTAAPGTDDDVAPSARPWDPAVLVGAAAVVAADGGPLTVGATCTGVPSSPITTTEPAVLCAPGTGVSSAAGGGAVTLPDTTGTARNSAAIPIVTRQPSSIRAGAIRRIPRRRADLRGRIPGVRAAREPWLERWRTDDPPGSLTSTIR